MQSLASREGRRARICFRAMRVSLAALAGVVSLALACTPSYSATPAQSTEAAASTSAVTPATPQSPRASPPPTRKPYEIAVREQLRYSEDNGLRRLAYLLIVTNHSLDELPINPLYFTLESTTGRAFRGSRPFGTEERALRKDYNAGALELIVLRAGQSAEGWLWFDTPPDISPSKLTYDNRLGRTPTYTLNFVN